MAGRGRGGAWRGGAGGEGRREGMGSGVAAPAQPALWLHFALPRSSCWYGAGIPKSENALRGSNVIPVHTPEQIKAAREASRIGREVLDIAAAALKPGVTGDEIDKIVHAGEVWWS